MTRRRTLAMTAVMLLLVAGAALSWLRWSGTPTAARSRAALADDVTAPPNTRIRVQVLNATRTRGLARRATRLLRDRGFDVVEIGTTAEGRDSTLVLDRSGHPEWARLVAGALGGAPVEARPDSSRYLDVTVLVGASWRAPAEPFHP